MNGNRLQTSKNEQITNYDSQQEKRKGHKLAIGLLLPIVETLYKRRPIDRESPYTPAEALREIADDAVSKNDPKQATLFNLLAESYQYGYRQEKLDSLRKKASEEDEDLGRASHDTRRQIRETRDKLFDFNGAIKDYIDQHPNESMDYIASLATASFAIQANHNGDKMSPREAIYDNMYSTVVGMRAERGAEAVLGHFRKVRIDYDSIDDEAKRRDLDSKGADYLVRVKLLGKIFDLKLDIKNSQRSTQDDHGNRLQGKIWSQLDESDYVNHSSKLRSGVLGTKTRGMQEALIEQVRLQYPGTLDDLMEKHGKNEDYLYYYLD